MIRLHCTKKLLAKLPLRDDDAQGSASVAGSKMPGATGRLRSKHPSQYSANDEPESPLSGWHANLILLQRRQCVLFVHDATRFPVFAPALKKADFANLDYWFQDGVMNTLLKTGADDELMDLAHAALGPLACDNDCNRSVQGSMNQMAQDLAHSIEYQGVSVADILGYRLGAWLADRPCTVKGRKDCIWPVRAMHELLRSQGT